MLRVDPVATRAPETIASTVTSRAARASLARLSGAAFVAYCSYSMCRTPLLPLFATDLGAGPALVGVVMGASTLTGIFLKLPAGALSDVVGRRRVLMAGAVVFAILPFTYLSVSTLGLLILLRFVHGSATAIFSPVASASVSDVAPSGSRGAYLSTYSTLQNAGQALGPVLAGSLIALGRFDFAFAAAGLIGLAVPFVVGRWQTAPEPAPIRGRWAELRRGISEVGRDRLVLMTSGAQAAQFVLHGTLNAFLPLYGREVVGLSVGELGWLFGLQTLTTLAMRPVIGLVSDRAGRRWAIVTGLTVCGAAVLSVSASRTPATLVASILVYAAGVATTTAATSAFITDLTRRARYGAAHGVFGTIYDVGDALGPLVSGVLVAALGYARMFQVSAGVALVTAAAFAAVSAGAEHRKSRAGDGGTRPT